MANQSEFKSVFSDKGWSDAMYHFLQVIFHLYPEDKFHHLIAETVKSKDSDEEVYKTVQQNLSTIKPFLSELTYALPALKKQKKEMSDQVLQLLENKTSIDGYLEIGSTGRYISELKKHLKLSGPIFITNDIAPTNSPADIMERGQLGRLGKFFDLNNYSPINENLIANESIDLVTCHIGLHHCPEELLAPYIQSIRRILRDGGMFIIRDHDVKSEDMAVFVSLVHTVFNLGLNVSWETNAGEHKSFKSVDEWSRIISENGFKDKGLRILQHMDPSDNTLMAFVKE